MPIAHVLLALLSAGASLAVQVAPARPVTPQIVRAQGISWGVVGGQPVALPGAAPVAATTLSQLGPGYHYLAVPVPALGLYELFLAYVPSLPFQGEAPLLVGYHGFGVSPLDLTQNTDFDLQCEQRGWFLFAPFSIVPIGQASNHFSALPAQTSTACALRWFLEHQAVDEDRVYGVGFSLGAGLAASFAARHQAGSTAASLGDPQFAALALHTGTFDIAHVWLHEPASRPQIELLYGGTPADRPFEYARCSTVQVGGAGPVPGGVHLAQNLSHIPLQLWYAPADPLGYLVTQAAAFEGALVANPGAQLAVHPVGGVTTHTWSTVDAVAACDWLAGHTRVTPLAERLIVDRDARYQHLEIERDPGQGFASLSYSVAPHGGSFSLTATQGLARVQTSFEDWGVSAQLPLWVTLEALDAGDTLIIGGLQQVPLSVVRDGQTQATGWSWSWQEQLLTIEEHEPGVHVWLVLP